MAKKGANPLKAAHLQKKAQAAALVKPFLAIGVEVPQLLRIPQLSKLSLENPEKLFSMGAMLGLGNQGAVYRATSHKSGMEVALKTCKFQEKDHLMAYLDSLILCESLRTCKLLAVARTFDAFEDSQEGPVYVTVWEEQQLLQGVSLDERLWRTQCRMPIEQAEAYLPQLCIIAHTLQRGGLVHRDIKPSNLHVGKDGLIRLLDFGLAVAEGSAVTHSIGTPLYMSPEALLPGRGTTYSCSQDWWSLGVVLYECLSGVEDHPFLEYTIGCNLSPKELAVKYTDKPLFWRPYALERVPAAWRELVEGLLAVDPAKRWGLEQVVNCAVFSVPHALALQEKDLVHEVDALLALRAADTPGSSVTSLTTAQGTAVVLQPPTLSLQEPVVAATSLQSAPCCQVQGTASISSITACAAPEQVCILLSLSGPCTSGFAHSQVTKRAPPMPSTVRGHSPVVALQSSMQEDTSAGADASGGRVLCPATLCANEVGPAANIPHPSSRLLQDGNAAGESGTTSNIALTATRYYFSGSKRLFRSGASRLASACTMQEPTAECTLASSGMAPLMLAGMPWALSACCQADKLCFAALHGSRELPRAAPSVHAGFRFCSSRWAEGMLTRAGVLL